MTLIVWLAQRTGHQRTDVKTIQASLPVGGQSSAGVGRPWEHLRVLKWKGSSEGQVGGLLKKGLFLLQSLEFLEVPGDLMCPDVLVWEGGFTVGVVRELPGVALTV